VNSWVIYVGGGYGAFLFEGSEQEAEEMRVHKARWERAVAAKRPADLKEINSNQPSLCWNHKGFRFKALHACDCGQCAGS
jgi:hypothetical protein